MEQEIIVQMIESKATRRDGKRNFVVFLTPGESKTLAYLEYTMSNPGFISVQRYLEQLPVHDAFEVLSVMDIYMQNLKGGN